MDGKRVHDSEPSGLTPNAKGCRRLDDEPVPEDEPTPLPASGLIKRRTWTPEEVKALISKKGEGGSWNEIANAINAEFGSTRTSSSCRLRFEREKAPTESAVLPSYRPAHEDHMYIKTGSQKTKAIKPKKDLRGEVGDKELATAIIEKRGYPVFIPPDESQAIYIALRTGFSDAMAEELTNSCPALRAAVMAYVVREVGNRPDEFASTLSNAPVTSLTTISISSIVGEFFAYFPEMVQAMTHLMLPAPLRKDPVAVARLFPRLALIYSVLMQQREPKCSLLQRAISLCLADNVSDVKVYDMLNSMGIALSYRATQTLIDVIGKDHEENLLVHVKKGMRLRFIGDNLNFTVGVGQETRSNHGHMVHMFAFAAFCSPVYYSDLPKTPRIQLQDLQPEDLLPNATEIEQTVEDCIFLLADIISRFIPRLQWMKEFKRTKFTDKTENELNEKTEVIQLPVLNLNEMRYSDVVQILDTLQGYADKIIKECDLPPDTQFHIGGDQLTRERFSGAKNLRIGNFDDKHRFSNLGPITFEFFHLSMNVLGKLIFRRLYNANDSGEEPGTMKHAREKLDRKSVKEDTTLAYDPNRYFFTNFFEAYVVEALLDFFGMEDVNCAPTKNCPKLFADKSKQSQEVTAILRKFLWEYVFHGWRHPSELQQPINVGLNVIKVLLSNGETKWIDLSKMRHSEPHDNVKRYGHLVLELGFLYAHFLHVMRYVDVERLRVSLKFLMVMLRGNNVRAKYPLEVLRFLVQQYSLLPQDEASRVLRACFVSLGKGGKHVPADQRMEWVIKDNKRRIRHLFSNKNISCIEKKSAANSTIAQVAARLLQQIGSVERFHGGIKRDEIAETRIIIDELRKVTPFQREAGRTYKSIGKCVKSMTELFDGHSYKQWFKHHKFLFNP